ncbi:MAG: hypothetical protein FWC00_03700 [Firmicutes bacterium]|nr:hypothetical protein [Bacillota bacterium]
MSRRLVVAFVAFIFIAGLAISGAFLFRVSSISVEFMNNPALITDQEGAVERYTVQARRVAGGRNILFGLNRGNIINTLQGYEPLIRVTNIEARFPNRLHISIRERTPMYVITHGARTAILDFELMIISDDPLVINPLKFQHGLINITGQFSLDPYNFSRFQVGDSLKDFVSDEYDIRRIQTLEYMALLFFNTDPAHDEYMLAHLIDRIDFEYAGRPASTMRIVVTHPRDDRLVINIFIYGYDNRFSEKIARAWYVLGSERDEQRVNITVSNDYAMTVMVTPLGGN